MFSCTIDFSKMYATAKVAMLIILFYNCELMCAMLYSKNGL